MTDIPLHVVHLLPHAGGGVGTVLKAIIQTSISVGGMKHALVSLESLNPSMRRWCEDKKIPFFENCWEKRPQLEKVVADSDVVHIHWWNHPLLNRLLSLNTLPAMRSVIWSHVNGLFAPQVFFPSLMVFPDIFVLATSYSLESSLVKEFTRNHPNQIKVIQSNAGVHPESPEVLFKPDGFRVGYIGTVDYSKMHKDFIDIWEKAKVTAEPAVVCGGPSEEAFRKEIAALGVEHLFDVLGVVENIADVFKELHVLMYPLNECHYGTGEQVLLEAMSFGVVPVVMNNGCERYLVRDGETGIIAQDKEDFIRALRFLKDNPQTRDAMAERGRQFVVSNFDIRHTVTQWHNLYMKVMQLPKRMHQMDLPSKAALKNDSIANLMLNSYGDTAEADVLADIICGREIEPKSTASLPASFYSETRGSPFHYSRIFPGEAEVDYVCGKLNVAVH